MTLLQTAVKVLEAFGAIVTIVSFIITMLLGIIVIVGAKRWWKLVSVIFFFVGITFFVWYASNHPGDFPESNGGITVNVRHIN